MLAPAPLRPWADGDSYSASDFGTTFAELSSICKHWPVKLSKLRKAEKHLHDDPTPAQTMHKGEMPTSIIYICKAKQRLQTTAYSVSLGTAAERCSLSSCHTLGPC